MTTKRLMTEMNFTPHDVQEFLNKRPQMLSEYSKLLAQFAAQQKDRAAANGGGVNATGTSASTEAGDAQQQQPQQQQQGQAPAQTQDQGQRQGQAHSHLNHFPHQQQPPQPAPPAQQPGVPPSHIPSRTQPQSQHTPLQQQQQPPAQPSQPQQPQPSQQPLVNRPAGQGGLSRPTNALGNMNMSVPQPPMHLTGHQVTNLARMQKRAEEATHLKTLLKNQAQTSRPRVFLSFWLSTSF